MMAAPIPMRGWTLSGLPQDRPDPNEAEAGVDLDQSGCARIGKTAARFRPSVMS
jgi:hypothetical protein